MRLCVPLVVFSLFTSLTVARAAPISGQVVGPDGEPMAGVEVVVQTFKDRVRQEYSTLQTDAAGKFALEAEPYSHSPDYFGRAIAYKPGLAIGGTTLKKGDNIIRLEVAGQASGHVADATGRPIADAVIALVSVFRKGVSGSAVSLGGAPLQSRFTTRTDKAGDWTLDDLPIAAQAYVEMKDPRFVRVRVPISVGEAAPPIVARPGAIVEGRVVFPDGQPAPNVKVMAQGQQTQAGEADATTGADGKFRLSGLPTGSFNIMINEPSRAWVAAARESVLTQEGETLAIEEFKLTRGALIEGFVTDATTGQPIAGAMIGSYGPHRPTSSAAADSVTTDEKGHYQMRVPPGQSGAYVMGSPKGYLNPASGFPMSQRYLTVEEGQTKTLSFQLLPAQTLTGVAVDGNGQPVENVKLIFRGAEEEGGYPVDDLTAHTDKNGVWELTGLKSGIVKLSTLGAWEVASPERVRLPHTGEVRVVLRRVEPVTLTGRVVTPQGEPVADTIINLNILLPMEETPNRYYGDNRAPLTTDAEGRFVLSELRANSKITLRSAQKSGYRFTSGGVVRKEGRQFTTTDIVLTPLSSRLSGQVVNAAGQPVADARVLSPDAENSAPITTGAEGRFTLQGLPAAEVLVVAATDETIGEARGTATTTGTGEITIRLGPPPPSPPHDLWRAHEILQVAWAEPEGTERVAQYARSLLPMTLAPYDPDLALQMATDPYGYVPDQALFGIIIALAESDPLRALMWAPPQLERITNAEQRFQAKLQLATRIAALDPDMAERYYQEIQSYWKERGRAGAGFMQINTFVALGQIAATLERDEARAWFDQALNVAAQMGGSNDAAMRIAIVGMAPHFPQEAEKLALQLPESGDPRVSPGQQLSQIVRALAPIDLAAARRLLAELEKKSGVQDFTLGPATRSVALSLFEDDPDAALQLARGIKAPGDRALTLVRIAPLLPAEKRATVFEEAFGAAAAYYNAPGAMARIAALAYNVEPPLGRELFRQAETRNADGTGGGSGARTPPLGFYLSRADPVAARLLLEAEYSRWREVSNADAGQHMAKVAQAMAAVNVERAVEIARSIPNDGQAAYARFEAMSRIAQYLLASSEVRATMSFDRRGASAPWSPGEDDDW